MESVRPFSQCLKISQSPRHADPLLLSTSLSVLCARNATVPRNMIATSTAGATCERTCLRRHVVHETITCLNCSMKNHRLAILFIAALDASGVKVLRVDQPVCDNALALFRRSAANRFSFTDCTSFVLMHNEDVSICAGFDQHFVKQGFALMPQSRVGIGSRQHQERDMVPILCWEANVGPGEI